MAVLYIRLRYVEEQRQTTQECTLDGVRVRIAAQYNATDGGWYLDILDLADVPIVAGIALVPGVDLLQPYRHLPVPPGTLYLQDTQFDAAATLTTLDVSALLLYREAGP